MKIRDVEAIVLEAPCSYGAPANGDESHGVKYCLLIKVTTDEGITGWSDVETSPQLGAAVVNSPESGLGMMEGLRHLVIGKDPFDVERLWHEVYRGTAYFGRRGVAIQVLSGFDIACHDIIGKAINRPLYQILGGAHRTHVKAYASTLFRPTPQDMARACEAYLEKGFRAIKFGWGGFGHDTSRDVALVEAARKAIGPDISLMVDAGWHIDSTANSRIELLRRLEAYELYWFEDFLRPDDYAGYARVKDARLGTRLAAGEQEATSWGFRQLIEQGQVDIVQPDLSRCGGITQFRKIAHEADRAGIDLCPHAWLTDLLTAASLHANAVLPRSLFLEYNVSDNPMLREVISNPIKLEADGTMAVPTGPGLGVEINEKAVEKYRVN